MTQRSYAPDYEVKPQLLRDYPEYVDLGKSTEFGGRVQLVRPSWDCDWYWGLGYLTRWDGRRKDIVFHDHFDGCMDRIRAEKANVNWHTAMTRFLFDGGLTKPLRDEKTSWQFVEIMKTLYNLRETAEVLGHGGSRYMTNPCADIIRNFDEVKRINTVVIPALVDELYKCLGY